MKNKLKYIYYGLYILCFITIIILLIKPVEHKVEKLYYKPEGKIEVKNLGSKIEEIIDITEEKTILIRFMLAVDTTYDNLEIRLDSIDGKNIFITPVEKYDVSEMIFGFDPIEKGKYILTITDKDGDPIEIKTAKSSKQAYLKKDKKKSLQIITYNLENYNFALWYPIFILAFLITIYPFVRSDNNEK